VGQARGRGRPPKFDRTEAIRRAMELFWRRGYATATARDIADAMQIKPSSFYNSFGDRGRVLREALSIYAANSPDAVLRAIAPGMPALPALWDMFREICRVRAADPDARGCLLVNTLAGLVGAEPGPGEEIVGAIRQRMRLIEGLLAQAEAQGEIAPQADHRRVSEALVTFLCGLNLISKVIRDERELWLMCERVLTGLGLAPGGRAGAT
jgi:TetR/AcrR family transcriptional regulator, transcriptional repressor for nem operon